MSLETTPSGKYKLRYREHGMQRSRTFLRKGDAERFETARQRRRQLGHAAIADDMALAELVKIFWRLYAKPNLAPSTRDYYKRALRLRLLPALGRYGVREINSPRRITRYRAELEAAGHSAAVVRKDMAILQAILSFALAEEMIDFNAAAGVRKPVYLRERAPHIFLPPAVEEIRDALDPRDATLVSVLAYSGPRPEEVVCRLTWGNVGAKTIRYFKTKKGGGERFTPLLAPLAEDLAAWRVASGRPRAGAPVFPGPYGGFWTKADWDNWRRRIWRHAAPDSTRPRDLRSSFITGRVYEGVPLTQISKEVGTSIAMIETHYAGVIENWDGQQIDAETQIRDARSGGRA